ncbi:alpha/beta hydrolase [Halomonas sediminis]
MLALEMIKVRELEIAVRIWHPDAPNTLIAWHGLARHGGDFAALARELGPQWRILAPDTPGRGLSSWSLHPAHDYLYSHYMRVALAVLDHFQLERVPWIGTSMGGLLGMLLASEEPSASRIQCLVLNDVGPELDAQALTRMATYFSVIKRFNDFSELLAELKEHYRDFGIDTEAGWREMALESARRLPDGTWSYHFDPRISEQFIHDTPRDSWADWARIQCPLMLIRGAHSPLLTTKSVARMQEIQPSLVTLEAPGCGHAPMLDRPGQVKPIATFLQAHGNAHSLPWWQRLKQRFVS